MLVMDVTYIIDRVSLTDDGPCSVMTYFRREIPVEDPFMMEITHTTGYIMS
jgi:hypothetical protein